MDGKIIQIIPAPDDLYSVYEDEGQYILSKVVSLALTELGEVVLLDIDDSGYIQQANEAINFIGVQWGNKKLKKKKWDDERW